MYVKQERLDAAKVRIKRLIKAQLVRDGILVQTDDIEITISLTGTETRLAMLAKDFFTSTRLEEAGVPVKHNLARIHKFLSYRYDSNHHHRWLEASEPGYTVREIVDLGKSRLKKCGSIGVATLANIEKVLNHYGIVLPR